MKKPKLSPLFVLIFAALSVVTTRAHAGESYFYQGESGYSTSFYLIGGQYSLYVYAKRPLRGPWAPESKSCIFGGTFERTWPTSDAMKFGPGLPISTIVPYKLGPTPVTLPAGLYRVYVATLTSCAWHFVLNSTNQNQAGLAPVSMLKRASDRIEPAVTSSLSDVVQFHAQYRTVHDAPSPASGTMQIIHDGQVVRTVPLRTGLDRDSGGSAFAVDLKWDPGDIKYLGKNTAKFIVKIGSEEFTSTGEFTLTH